MTAWRAVATTLVGAGLLIGAGGAPTGAETRTARLSGLDEVPVIITGATGKLSVKIASDLQSIEYTLSYQDIEGGDVLQAHIHLGQAHTTGNIVLFLCTNIGGAPASPPASPTPACPVGPDGSVSGTLIGANVIPRASQGVGSGDLAAVIAAIRAGVAYANVHSVVYPTGEIRANFSGRH